MQSNCTLSGSIKPLNKKIDISVNIIYKQGTYIQIIILFFLVFIQDYINF